MPKPTPSKEVLLSSDATASISDDMLTHILRHLDTGTLSEKQSHLRHFLEMAIRMYVLRSSMMNSSRLNDVLADLAMKSLGHTRAD